MTPSADHGPGTVMDLLYGPGQGAPEALARQVLSAGAGASLDGALTNLSSATRQAAVREAAGQAAGLLDVDLTGLLLAGWRTHHDLTAAARRTLAAPGSSELLDLVTHQITVSQQPFVTVDVLPADDYPAVPAVPAQDREREARVSSPPRYRRRPG